jgi:hypothetical protein
LPRTPGVFKLHPDGHADPQQIRSYIRPGHEAIAQLLSCAISDTARRSKNACLFDHLIGAEQEVALEKSERFLWLFSD